MLRIIFLIILILLAIPFFNKAKDYLGEQAKKGKTLGKAAVNLIKYGNSDTKK